jgi:transposase
VTGRQSVRRGQASDRAAGGARKTAGTLDRSHTLSASWRAKARHSIENVFCWNKQFRGIATRYDKTATNFLAAFHMVAALCWLN